MLSSGLRQTSVFGGKLEFSRSFMGLWQPLKIEPLADLRKFQVRKGWDGPASCQLHRL